MNGQSDFSTRVRRRGTILVVTMAVCFTLAAVVMVLVRSMSIEAVASANTVATAEADSIERGGEQYVLALLNTAVTNGGAYTIFDPTIYTDDYFDGVRVGNGFLWLLRPVYDDPDLPLFGLVDECSKLDINVATYDQLMALPGMTDDVANAIIDWRDTDEDVSNSTGAESAYYNALDPSYFAKNAPFETVEELLMVRGIDHTMLFGDGSAGPMGVATGMLGSGGQGFISPTRMGFGWYDLLTIHGYSAPNQNSNNQPARGMIDVNTASSEVLYALGLQNGDPENLVSARSTQAVLGTNDTSWVSNALSGGTGQIANQITGESYRYSADILAASPNGRAFRRVRVVFDTSTTPITILSRRDVTDQGWPLDPQLLAEIRRGAYADGQSGSIMGGTQR